MTIEEEAAQATDQIPELVDEEAVMTTAVTHKPGCAQYRAAAPVVEQPYDPRAVLRERIDRLAAKRSSPEAIRQAEAAIRAGCDGPYTSNDIRALQRLAIVRAGR
jgi:2-methylisocitrate lyase-like PEP mutase family enzyme